MIDQSLIQSGFDAEFLMGARYLRYLLLTSVETGTFPLRFSIEEPALDVIVHPPEDYQRLYAPHPDAEPLPPPVFDAFETEILFDHEMGADLRVRMRVDLRSLKTGQELAEQFVDLFLDLTLEAEAGEEGVSRNARLRLEVVDLEVDLLLGLALAAAGATPQDLLPAIKERVDRTVGLGVASSGQNLQRIEISKLEPTADHPAAFAVYLNLRLKNGPEPDAFQGDRGDLSQARNFLPEGDDLAFGLRGSLFDKLGDDAKFRMAEETSKGSGEFHFPIREDPSNPNSEQKGRFKNITVKPLPGNVLRVDIHGEAFVDDFPDPDFHFKFDFKPTIEEGVLDFEVEHDLDVDLFGEALVFLGILSLALFSSLGAAGFAALIVLVVQELIVEPIAQSKTSDVGLDASFLDALPHHLTAERRRWDPFYATLHQVVALVDGIQINREGIGFSGKAVLGKEAQTVGHVVIRDEARNDNGEISELRYRVRDFEEVQDDFTPVFLATDRRAFARASGDPEGDLFTLTLPQVLDRIDQARLRELIGYVPKRVYIRDNQIRLLLCISETEIAEERDRFIDEFRDATRAQILDERGDELRDEVTEELTEELGEPPTEEQIQKALDACLDELVSEQEETFVEEELPELLEEALEPRLRFDLDSPEFFALQDDRVLFIRGYQRIRMERDGVVSEYYRDRPDGDPRDNLLSLPRYSPVAV